MKPSGNYLTGWHAAFTRVDLVAVVAMVVLLLVIVFSAYAKPHNRVYQITDVSNHRRLMQAMTAFAGDNTGTLPNCGWGEAQQSWLYAANLPVGNPNFATYEAIYTQQLVSLTNGQLFPYLQDARVFMCPADRPETALFLQRSVYISSYTWNAAVNGYGAIYGSTPSSYKLSQFRPDAILEWEDDDLTPFYWNDGSSYPDEGISQRHDNTCVGMFGGGVATVRPFDWYGNSLAGAPGGRGGSIPASQLPNRVWCNPGAANGL